jgi:hypothetical protein
MLSFIFVIVCVFFNKSESVQFFYPLFLYVFSLEIQHEQSEQSSLNLTDLTKHKKWKTTTYNVGKLGLDYMGQVQQCGRVKPVNGVTALSS